jgi:hypothetical protein
LVSGESADLCKSIEYLVARETIFTRTTFCAVSAPVLNHRERLALVPNNYIWQVHNFLTVFYQDVVYHRRLGVPLGIIMGCF